MKFSILFIIVIVSYVSSEDSCNFQGFEIKLNEWAPAPIGQCKECRCQSVNPLKVDCIPCPVSQLRPDQKDKCSITKGDKTLQYPNCCPKVVCQ